ncbi:hypothetical protein [Nostoc sphaeroides]|uniref:hypothetical protein n=1 Tax=Nostoc sphaeroides TaxID=446679 RepID=UPI0018832DC2
MIIHPCDWTNLNLVYYCRHFCHVNTPKFGGFLLEKLDGRALLEARKQAKLLDRGQLEVQLPLWLGGRVQHLFEQRVILPDGGVQCQPVP